MPPAVLLLFRIIYGYPECLLCLDMEMKFALLRYVKNCFGILMETASNLCIVLVWTAKLTKLIFMIPGHGGSFHIPISSSVSFFRAYCFIPYTCFTCLVRATPWYCILVEAIVKCVVSLIPFSFSVHLSFVPKAVSDC